MTTPLSQRVSLASLSADECDGVIVVSLRGELDFVSCSVLQTFFSDILGPERARCVVDLTGLTFIDCACLDVLARHCVETRTRGGSFALAGPQGIVRRILSVTGLLTWFEYRASV